MEQIIKIKAMDDEELLGTFTISILNKSPTNALNNYLKKNQIRNKEYPLNETISLYNVPIVDEFDDKTPIQYYNLNDFSMANIMLLEENEYVVSFDSNLKGLDSFYTLLNGDFEENPLKLPPNSPSGFLNFGSYVGKTFLDIASKGEIIYKIPIEVRSRKINYNDQYSAMIADLSKYSSGIVFDINSPLYQSFDLGDSRKQTPYEDFMILEYLFRDENLPSTIEYLSRNLYSVLENTVEEVPTSFAENINPNDLIDVFSNSENLHKTENKDSIWYNRTKSYVPLRIKETKYVDNIDVPENRFYKDFLIFVENLISDLIEISPKGYVKDKLKQYKEEMSYYLSQRYFKDISRMDYAPLNSQVLQKKEGYRDILEYYLMFEFGFKMVWNEIFDEFKGYEKKLFDLYEFWCYFELLDVLDELSENSFKFDDIFQHEKDNKFNIKLKHNLSNSFHILMDDTDIKVSLSYNRTFNRYSKEFKSYSIALRPDYTLIFDIDDESYVVHFDAKYKIDFNESFKKEDINKMHTYKDAIDNTIGAYVLFPGNDNKEVIFSEKNSNIKSVGAFPLNPGEDRENKNSIKNFILELIEKLLSSDEIF